MKEIPWWASSQNRSLCEKKEESYGMMNASELFSFPDLTKVILIQEGNQGGEYFRFFGFFEKDTERYFKIVSIYDLSVPFFSLKEGQYLTISKRIWKVFTIQRNGFCVEFVLL